MQKYIKICGAQNSPNPGKKNFLHAYTPTSTLQADNNFENCTCHNHTFTDKTKPISQTHLSDGTPVLWRS